MKRDHRPQRTCGACGKKALKNELIRWVARQKEIVEDTRQNESGRGIYSCSEQTCRDRLLKNKKKLKVMLRLQCR